MFLKVQKKDALKDKVSIVVRSFEGAEARTRVPLSLKKLHNMFFS
jgi:hypothetical protein